MPENLRFEPMELLSWPDAPDDVVLSVKRMDVADQQRMWVITNSKSGYKLQYTSRLSSGDWLSFAAGEPYATIVAATQSDSARWQHDLDEKIVSDDD